MIEGIGDQFQSKTKYLRGHLQAGARGWTNLDWSNKPDQYKTYPARSKLSLPPPKIATDVSFQACLLARRSVRRYAPKALDLHHLAYLLWASAGIHRREGDQAFRTAPSAGALYPIETYLLVNNVATVPQGVYHYSVCSHLLEELKRGDYRGQLVSATIGQRMCAEAAVCFIWTAVFARSKWKYQQRAYRYIYLDAGHIAQNLALAAVSVGLGSCQIGALYDEEVNQLLNVDGLNESVLYVTTVGHPMAAS